MTNKPITCATQIFIKKAIQEAIRSDKMLIITDNDYWVVGYNRVHGPFDKKNAMGYCKELNDYIARNNVGKTGLMKFKENIYFVVDANGEKQE
jgi:hypothetical protein